MKFPSLTRPSPAAARWTLGALAGAILYLSVPGAAQANTIGANVFGASLCLENHSWVDPSYVVPSDGTITSFSYQSGTHLGEGTAGNSLAFKVFRPSGGDAYEVVGTSPLVTLATDSDLETFPLASPIAVEAGDLLGLWVGDAAHGVLPGCLESATLPTGSHWQSTPNLDVGATIESQGEFGGHLNVSAELTSANPTPDCSGATPSTASVWPPNGKFTAVSIDGVTDPDGDPVTITIDSIRQDEAVGGAADGSGVGSPIASLRAERNGNSDGRAYHVGFTADDGLGGSCSGTVEVEVPHDQAKPAVDGGALFDSTVSG